MAAIAIYMFLANRCYPSRPDWLRVLCFPTLNSIFFFLSFLHSSMKKILYKEPRFSLTCMRNLTRPFPYQACINLSAFKILLWGDTNYTPPQLNTQSFHNILKRCTDFWTISPAKRIYISEQSLLHNRRKTNR